MKIVAKIVICLLSFVLVPLSKVSAQLNTDRLTAIGRNALYFDDYVVSIQYFNQVIKLKPYLSEPYLLRAIAKIQLSDWQGALMDLNTSILRNPFQPGAYYTRGYVYRQLEDYPAAEKDFTDALIFSPENKTYLLLRADVLSMQKRYDEAMSDIDFLLRRDPHSPSLLFEKGIICLQRQDTTCAHEQFTLTTQYDSNNAGSWSALGLVEMMQRHDSAALIHLSNAINLGSRYAGDYINRGILRYNRHDYKGALADYDKAVELAPRNAQCYYNRGILRSEVGDKNRALDDFDQAIDLEPDRTEMRYQRAATRMDLRQWSAALEDLDTIRRHYPTFLPAYYLAANAHTSLGHTKEAYALRQQAYDLEHEPRTRQTVNVPDTTVHYESAVAKRRNPRKEFSAQMAQNSVDIQEEDQAYESDTRGLIQRKQVAVMNEPNIQLSYYRQPQGLRQTHYDHYTIDDYNRTHLLPSMLYVSIDNMPITPELINYHFDQITYLSTRMEEQLAQLTLPQQAALYFARALEFAMVQDYQSAIDDCTHAIIADPSHTFMYFARANWRYQLIEYQRISGGEKIEMDFEIMFREYDYVISHQPDFAFAYYNKANILCIQREWDAAIREYTRAIEADDDFAEAYFNRGLTYIYTERIEQGLRDLSKAGELGIYQAYNLITRFQ